MSTRRKVGPTTYIPDAVLFIVGIAIILKQAGILLTPPEHGPSIELIGVGLLLCNGPVFLQALKLTRGTFLRLAAQEPEQQDSPSEPSSEQ